MIDPDILFQDYSFSSSTIPALVQHFSDYAAWLVERFDPGRVVEFGCNDGVLLAPLQERGVDAWGVDISENITELAREKGLNVLTGFFDVPAAEEIRERAGRADVVTGSNAFAHNEHPEWILDAAKAVLAPGGHLCLEVMYAGDLLELMQWDTLYHEHLTFYSLGTLRTLLERHGFHLVHAERIPMHGGSLRAAAALEPAEPTEGLRAVEAYEEETRLNDPETWDRLRGPRRAQDRDRPRRLRRAAPREAHLGLRRRRQGDHVGQRVRDGLSGGDGRRVAAARGQAHAGHAHPDRLPRRDAEEPTGRRVRHGLELRGRDPAQRGLVRRHLGDAPARPAVLLTDGRVVSRRPPQVKRRALITGVAGQDGSHLAELLVEQGYEVSGLVRRDPSEDYENLAGVRDRVELLQADLLDQLSLVTALRSARRRTRCTTSPSVSFVPASWDQPVLTAQFAAVGVTAMLEAIRHVDPQIRFYQASSSEIFGEPLSLPRPRRRRSRRSPPYGVAKAYGHFMVGRYRRPLRVCYAAVRDPLQPRVAAAAGRSS